MNTNNKAFFLLFSHTLTQEQETEARTVWGVNQIIKLPPTLQSCWSQIEPKGELEQNKIKSIIDWMKAESKPRDLVLVQGEFGATFLMVDFCLQSDLIPVLQR